RLADLDSLPQLIAQLQGAPPSARKELATHPGAVAPGNRPPAESAPAPQKKTIENPGDQARVGAVETSPSLPLDDDSALARWKQTLGEIGDMTADCAAKASRVAISGPNRLVVTFRKAYTQAQQYCERPDGRQKLEQTFSRIAGRIVRIDFVTLTEDREKEQDA